MSERIVLPGEIEKESMRIIAAELAARGKEIPADRMAVVKRVIHTTADFEYADTLTFTEEAVALGKKALMAGCTVVTDTNMALAGVSKATLAGFGGQAVCYMADPAVAEAAKKAGTTRAYAAMGFAAERHPGAVFAVGNAPTALFRLAELMAGGCRPALIIGVPVGFVNVVESKEQVLAAARQAGVPAIVAMGRKGGSGVAAAIVNALLYEASGRTL